MFVLQEGRCAYGLAVMAILWITESLPLAATALLPVIIFPLFGVMKSSEISSNYIKVTTYMYYIYSKKSSNIMVFC